MTTPSLASGSTDAGVRFEPAGRQVICVDMQSIAGLIDAMAGYDPTRLPVLLAMIWESSFKVEARTVLCATVACRDPLSHLCAICTDAIQTLADLEKLTRVKAWQSIVIVLGHQDLRACALLNACDHEIARLQGSEQMRYKSIRARLEAAAGHERLQRSEELRAIASLRQERCPGIWEMYEFWRDKE